MRSKKSGTPDNKSCVISRDLLDHVKLRDLVRKMIKTHDGESDLEGNIAVVDYDLVYLDAVACTHSHNIDRWCTDMHLDD